MSNKNDNLKLSLARTNGAANQTHRETSARELTSLQLRTPNQKKYSKLIDENIITFCIGPAGTGKSHIAAIKGLDGVIDGHFDQLLLFRPPVECGPKQGFLPGDLGEKTDPYMQALQEILTQHIGTDLYKRMVEEGKIKVGFLGFIRGATFTNAYVVLDESQNVTIDQMKTFLTRVGKSSKVVLTGDVTQVDLPKAWDSGLAHALNILQDIEGIAFAQLEAIDNQRHPLVTKINQRYENKK